MRQFSSRGDRYGNDEGFGYIEDIPRSHSMLYDVDSRSAVRILGADKSALDKASPAMLAAKVTVPVLLVHGGKDKRAPVEHAEAMRAALVRAGHPPEWFLAPNEGHGFYDTKNVTEFYQRLEAFLARQLAQ